MTAKDEGAQRQDERVETCPRQVEIRADFAVVLALVPSHGAERREGFEYRDAQRAAVDERATVVVDDLRMLTDQSDNSAAHVGQRIFGWCRHRLRNDRNHH